MENEPADPKEYLRFELLAAKWLAAGFAIFALLGTTLLLSTRPACVGGDPCCHSKHTSALRLPSRAL